MTNQNEQPSGAAREKAKSIFYAFVNNRLEVDWDSCCCAPGTPCDYCNDRDKYNSDAINSIATLIDQYEQEIQRLRNAYSKENDEISQIAGKVLDYPWFKDDQQNFPGATEKDGVCVGDHVAASIVMELANRFVEYEHRLKQAEKWMRHSINCEMEIIPILYSSGSITRPLNCTCGLSEWKGEK
jgi:hypothetical protein